MVIDLLVNDQKLIYKIAKMNYEEFVLGVHTKFSFNDVLQIHSNTFDYRIPLTLVALENQDCLGSVSIFENDLDIREEYTPWLASLCVKKDRRNEGIGLKLVAAAISKAKELGFDELYLRTETASNYYRKIGWSYIETVSDEIHEKIDIFKIKL